MVKQDWMDRTRRNGLPMVCNIRRAGYETFVYGSKEAGKVLEAGAQWLDDIQVGRRVDILCTMVGYPEDVELVVWEKRFLASMKLEVC